MPYKDSDKQKEYQREHYLKYKEKYLKNKYVHRKELREKIRKLKTETSCYDCGKNYPYYVMDFDHLENKEYLIARLINDNKKEALEKEIQKCNIVCANCHRQRTHNRLSNLVRNGAGAGGGDRTRNSSLEG
jgi:NAD-dependent dihydropyrimidine dehydrogenase PreA subunit